MPAALLASGGPTEAEPIMCLPPDVTVEARTEAIAAAACAAVEDTARALAVCGLVPAGPVRVTVVKAPVHPDFGVCLGYFDSRTGCLEVAEPDSYADLLSEEDARRSLPAETLLNGIVAHEFTHAVVGLIAGERPVAAADQEFIAAVFEMQSYGEEARAMLMTANPVRPEGTPGMVNLGIYSLAPRVFANNAWQLFSAQEDGCALVRGIVNGEVSMVLR